MTTRSFSRKTDLRDTVYAADVNELQAAIESLSVVTTQGDLVVAGPAGAEARLARGTKGKALFSNGTTLEYDFPTFVDIKWYGATYSESPSAGQITANDTAFEDIIADASTYNFTIVISGKVGVSQPVHIDKAGTRMIGSREAFRGSTLSLCNGPWIFWAGTTKCTSVVKIGDPAQTVQLDRVTIAGFGIWGANDATITGLTIRSKGLIATPVPRTKGVRVSSITISNCAFPQQVGPHGQSSPWWKTFTTSTDFTWNQYLRPTARANSTAYTLGTIRTNTEGTAQFVVTTAGTSDTSQPAGMVSPSIGATVTDGTVVWTCQTMRAYRVIAEGTTSATNPSWSTTTGDTIVSGTVTLLDVGAAETGRNEEQSDDIMFDHVWYWGGSSTICGPVFYGSNAGDAATLINNQFYLVNNSDAPMLDLQLGGFFSLTNCYAGGTQGDFIRIWQTGNLITQNCQCEGMRYFLYKSPLAPQTETDAITIMNSYFDDAVVISAYTRILSINNVFKSTGSLSLTNAQWHGIEDHWQDSGRTSYPLTLSGVAAYHNERYPKATANGWYIEGEKIFRRTITSGAYEADIVTTGNGGLKATTWSSAEVGLTVGTQRQNTAGTRSFEITALASGTSATGAVAEPAWNTTVGATTVEAGSVNITWICRAQTPTTKGVGAIA